jgi:hypothetical protein
MPTINDLHAAFTQLEHDAPTALAAAPGPATSNADIVYALARTTHRPRRTLTAIGGAAAVAATVAAIVTVPSITSSGHHGRPGAAAPAESATSTSDPAPATPAAASTGPLSLTTNAYQVTSLPAGFVLTYDAHTATTETLQLGTAPDAEHGALVVVEISTSAALEPVAPVDAQPVTVNGRPALASTQFALLNAPHALPVAGVLWTDGAGHTVFAYHPADDPLDNHPDNPISQATLLATANALNIGNAQAAVRTPVKFGYLPQRSDLRGVVLGVQKFDPRAPEVEVDYDHLIVTVLPGVGEVGKFGPAVDKAPQTTSIQVNGFTGLYSPQDTVTYVDNGTVTISINNYSGNQFVGPGLGLPLAEVTKILNAVTVTTTPFDQAGWFPLAAALP